MSSPPTRSEDSGSAVSRRPALERSIGPMQATAINMTQMCGIGPFVTNMIKRGGGWLSQFKFLPLYPRLWETFNDSCGQLGR